jgi:hypothetical protein
MGQVACCELESDCCHVDSDCTGRRHAEPPPPVRDCADVAVFCFDWLFG